MDHPPPDTARRTGACPLVLYLMLLWYGLGAYLLESVLNYPLWRDMGGRMADADFRATRRAHLWKVTPLFVVPLVLRTPATLALALYRPPWVPRWAAPAALALQAVFWASTALIQIPLQAGLTDRGYSRERFDRLIVTDFWLRVVPIVGEAGIGVVLARRVAVRLAAGPPPG